MKTPGKLITAILYLLAAAVSFSATRYVDNNAPGDPGPDNPAVSDPLEDGSAAHPFDAIQKAVNAADPNDTILIADGTYTGPGNRDIDFLGKAITVQSESGPENCIIDCQGTAEDPHRAFIFQNGETHDSILSGVTIINGYAEQTDITYEQSNVQIMRRGCFGSGILSNNASPFISNCMIEQCMAPQGGGGIYCFSGSPIITDSTFRNNRGAGAAISAEFCEITITNCRFTANDSTQYTSIISLGAPTVIFNGPGAVFLAKGSATVSHCVFSGNTGAYNGGLTCVINDTRIDHCTFVGNRGEENASIAGFCPEAYQQDWPDRMIHASNCIFTNNSLNNDEPEVPNGFFIEEIQFFSAIGTASLDTPEPLYEINYSCLDVLDSALPGFGNIQADPLFVDPGRWDGDTWVDGDYHLQSAGWRWDINSQQWAWDNQTSPCIDAGNPAMPLGGEPTTLDVDPLNRWSQNIRVNMGAYGRTAEAGMAPPGWMLLCDLDNSLRVDLGDLAPMAAAWLTAGRALPPDVTRNGTVNLEDLAQLAAQWLQTPHRGVDDNIPIPGNDDDIPVPGEDDENDWIPVPGG